MSKRTWLSAVIGLVLVVASFAPGCFRPEGAECEQDTDCFSGERCLPCSEDDCEFEYECIDGGFSIAPGCCGLDEFGHCDVFCGEECACDVSSSCDWDQEFGNECDCDDHCDTNIDDPCRPDGVCQTTGCPPENDPDCMTTEECGGEDGFCDFGCSEWDPDCCRPDGRCDMQCRSDPRYEIDDPDCGVNVCVGCQDRLGGVCELSPDGDPCQCDPDCNSRGPCESDGFCDPVCQREAFGDPDCGTMVEPGGTLHIAVIDYSQPEPDSSSIKVLSIVESDDGASGMVTIPSYGTDPMCELGPFSTSPDCMIHGLLSQCGRDEPVDLGGDGGWIRAQVPEPPDHQGRMWGFIACNTEPLAELEFDIAISRTPSNPLDDPDWTYCAASEFFIENPIDPVAGPYRVFMCQLEGVLP